MSHHTAGDNKQLLVQDFLARCTPEQREFGLPPTGERALADDDRMMVTVPEGLSEGPPKTIASQNSFSPYVTLPIPTSLFVFFA